MTTPLRDDEKDNYFRRWYTTHKNELSQKRKEKYRTDPEYRAKHLKQSTEYRAEKRSERPALNPEYIYSQLDVAEKLKVSDLLLRKWRAKGYYPEPYLYANKLYFTEKQLQLIKLLADFHHTRTGRKLVDFKKLRDQDDEKFREISLQVFANWE